MATYYARSSGNINGSIWATTPSGSASSVIFVSGDILLANSFTITVNVSTNLGSTGEVRNDTTGGATAGGVFNLTNGVVLTANVYVGATTNAVCVNLPSGSGSATINGNIFGGAGTNCIGASNNNSTGTLTIVGNVTGGSGAGAGAHGAVNNQAGTLNVTGTVTGGSVNTNHGISNSIGGTINIIGNVNGGTGSTCYGVANSNGTINITGNITGGSANNAFGVILNGNGSITITGNVIGGSFIGGVLNNSIGTITIVGTSTGSSVAVGSSNNSTGTLIVTRAKGNGFGSGSVGLNSVVGVSSLQNGTTRVYEIEYGDLGQSPTSGPISFVNDTTNKALFYRPSLSKKTLVDSAASLDLPAASNVRNGTTYNFGSNTGTCIIPSASSVAFGVPVDNTTGTATLTPQNVWNALTSSIGTSGSIGERLKNAATIDSVSSQVITIKGN